MSSLFHCNGKQSHLFASVSERACAPAKLQWCMCVRRSHAVGRAAVLELSHWGAVTHIAVRPSLNLTSAP